MIFDVNVDFLSFYNQFNRIRIPDTDPNQSQKPDPDPYKNGMVWNACLYTSPTLLMRVKVFSIQALTILHRQKIIHTCCIHNSDEVTDLGLMSYEVTDLVLMSYEATDLVLMSYEL